MSSQPSLSWNEPVGHSVDHVVDVAGIGIGPANLSFAALLQPLPEVSYQLFDKRPEFSWHPGLALAGATLQVSYLKDLVTLVDPTSPYSFLSFLAAKKRLYRFLTARFPAVLRAEYEQYFRWVSKSISGLDFGCEVLSADFDDRRALFRVHTTRGEVRAKNLLMGTGLAPHVPPSCMPFLGDDVFHASEFALRDLDLAGRDVVVLGGGQSGAEVFLDLLRRPSRPGNTTWVTRRANFSPLDDSPFANELFFPEFAQYFFRADPVRKSRILADQKLASDGIDNPTLEDIYRQMYALECVEGVPERYRLLPDFGLIGLRRRNEKLVLTLQGTADGLVRHVEADVVILCTGYEAGPPDFLGPLVPRLSMPDGRFKVGEDFSLSWDGPANRKIYVQNAARHEWGAADPNLSLLAWRSAMIINSLVGHTRYDISEADSVLRHGQPDFSADRVPSAQVPVARSEARDEEAVNVSS